MGEKVQAEPEQAPVKLAPYVIVCHLLSMGTLSEAEGLKLRWLQ